MRTHTKNLLSLNKNAFRFLHDAEGFDFEKPYFITEQAGKFTVNTVINAVKKELNPAQCKIIVFVVPVKASYRKGLFFATLERGKFDGTRKNGVSYWDYRTDDRAGDIDCCYGVGDFEKLRKNETEKIFIVAQNKAYTVTPTKKNIDLSARFTLINSQRCGDGRGNTYIGELKLEATDGSGSRFEYKPYNTYYGHEKKSENIADFIDHSGYLLRPHRFDLMEKAERLRKERKQAEANRADFTQTTTMLQGLIDEARVVLSGSVMACNDSGTADELSRKLNSFSRALSYFADYKRKLNLKEYASIDRINYDIDIIKSKLDYCITGNK